jgi:hypothetical protein
VINSNRHDKDDLMDQQRRFMTIDRPRGVEPVTLYVRPVTPTQALHNVEMALVLVRDWREEALELRLRDRVEIQNLQELLADALWDLEQLRKRCEEAE